LSIQPNRNETISESQVVPQVEDIQVICNEPEERIRAFTTIGPSVMEGENQASGSPPSESIDSLINISRIESAVSTFPIEVNADHDNLATEDGKLRETELTSIAPAIIEDALIELISLSDVNVGPTPSLVLDSEPLEI
jgi:hypothetical protein